MTNTTPESLRPYEFHGLNFSINGTQATGECPFCSGSKFFINKKTGQYDCKNCGEKGNKYTFLTKYHQSMLGTVSQLKQIRKLRGNLLPVELLEASGLTMDNDGNVLFPIKNPDKENLTNLRKWNPQTKIFYNTPTCCTLFYAKWSDEGPIYVCEGEWDGLSLQCLMDRAKYTKKCSIVAVPGANIFNDSWVFRFKDRDVILLYDNDHDKQRPDGSKFNPGKDGMVMATKKLETVASSVKSINWNLLRVNDKILPDGYDIRDFLADAIKTKKSKRALLNLLKACETVVTSSKKQAQILKRESFDDVVTDFQSVYAFGKSFQDALACCFASIISLKIEGNPLWLFLVAPASSGKTAIIDCFETAYDYTEHLSKLKDTALVSGWRNSGQDAEDPSMLPRLKNKVLFLKDFTAVLSMGVGEKEKLFGMLRDAYDGRFTQHYGTGLSRTYTDLYFGIVAGVTHAIHAENRSSLGERFLKVNLLDEDFVEEDHIRKALSNIGEKKHNNELLQGSVNGFLKYLNTKDILPAFTSEMYERLIALSQIVAFLRTTVDRSHGREMAYRPQPEIGSRIATQLKKLGLALAIVYEKQVVDEECYRIMQKVAFDSCIGWQLEIFQVLCRSDEPQSVNSLAEDMQVHPNQIRKVIEDCMQLGIVTMTREKKSGRGNRAFFYRVSGPLKLLMKQAKVSFNKQVKVIKTPSNRTKRSLRRKAKRG